MAPYGISGILPCLKHGKRILLHFGAVDYEAEVWVNGVSVGSHRGDIRPLAWISPRM